MKTGNLVKPKRRPPSADGRSEARQASRDSTLSVYSGEDPDPIAPGHADDGEWDEDQWYAYFNEAAER